MTDFLADTPAVARAYCPNCEPDADPLREILDVRWCATHAPSWAGLDDATVTTEAILSGSAEAGGADNLRWCEAIHGQFRQAAGREPRRRPRRPAAPRAQGG